jgi:signal transduction histidine kinase
MRIYVPPGREQLYVVIPVVLFLLLPLGLSLWGGYSTFHRTVQPLRRLLGGIRRVEQGDMEYRLKDTGRTEIALAAQSFDKMAESLERKIGELAEKKKVEEISELKSHFISMVSHDLKTPLASIKGAAENVLEELAGPVSDRQRTYLEMILKSSDNLQQMISNILDLSRIESGRMSLDIEVLDIKHEAEHVLRFIQPLLDEKSLEARITVVAKKTAIAADRTRLWQIINNVMANAIRYSPRGGRIDILVEDSPDRDAALNPMLKVTIVDQGPGVAEDEQKRIFEPFYTPPSEGTITHGAGLGLPIVKQLVELHGGTVSMTNSAQGGASFAFTLPLKKPE